MPRVNKSTQVRLRLTDADKEALQGLANKYAYGNISAYIRMLIFKEMVKSGTSR